MTDRDPLCVFLSKYAFTAGQRVWDQCAFQVILFCIVSPSTPLAEMQPQTTDGSPHELGSRFIGQCHVV